MSADQVGEQAALALTTEPRSDASGAPEAAGSTAAAEATLDLRAPPAQRAIPAGAQAAARWRSQGVSSPRAAGCTRLRLLTGPVTRLMLADCQCRVAGLPREMQQLYMDFLNIWQSSEGPWHTPAGRGPGSTQMPREHSATSLDGRAHSVLVRPVAQSSGHCLS